MLLDRLVGRRLEGDEALCGLCALLLRAEEMAARVSAAQARLAKGPLGQAFHEQSRHERSHAALFRAALAASGTGSCAATPSLAHLDRYEARLARGDLSETLVGLQGVLEGFGALLFERVSLDWRDTALIPVRRFLSSQERAHHAMGLEALRALCPGGPSSRLEAAARDYRRVALQTLEASAPLLRRVGVDPGQARFDDPLACWIEDRPSSNAKQAQP